MHVIGNAASVEHARYMELLILDRVPDIGFYTLDASGHVLGCNRGAQLLTGYSPPDVVARHFSELFAAEDVAVKRPQRALEAASQAGSYQEDAVMVRSDGSRYRARVTLTALKEQVGTLQGFAALTRDISGQATSEARYRAIFENSHDAILLTRPADGSILAANPAACAMFGYSRQELLSTTRDRLLDLADPRFADAWVERGDAGTVAAELTFIRKGGAPFTAWVSSRLFTDECDGQMASTTIHDTSEGARAAEALRQSEERFRLLYEQAPIGMAQVDGAGRVTAVNRRFAEITGYSSEEARGFTHAETTLPEDAAVIGQQGKDVLSGKTDVMQYEKRLLRKDRSTTWVRVTGRLIRDSAGQAQWGIALYEDISERKRAEEALQQSEEVFRATFEHAPLGIGKSTLDGRFVDANSKLTEILGYTKQELAALTWKELTHPDDVDATTDGLRRLDTGETDSHAMEKRYRRKDGSFLWVSVTVSLASVLGQPRYHVVTVEDISERRRAEEALQLSEEKFRATFEHAPLGIAECTLDGRFIDVNSKLSELLGYTKQEFDDLTYAELTHRADLEDTIANLHKLTAGETGSYAMEKRYVRKDRSFVWVNVTKSLASLHGKPPYLVVTVEDITARRIAEEGLKRAMEASYQQANHDTLTGLANRASFNDRLKDALAYARRDGHLVALHALDLDRFKSINDTFGHHIGDLLLKDVAQRIQSHVRATDLAARLGGDEFVVVQTHLGAPAAAGIVARKLVEDLNRKYVLEGQHVQSGASIGIAIYPDDADDAEGLLKRADMALYDAKNRGRFNYQFYRKELGAAIIESQQLERELLQALDENEFFLNYQPQFDVKSGRITGIEALLRWQHPTRGRLAAADFIHAAERARLILQIGEWVLRTACRQFKEWVDAGLSVPLIVHLSPMQWRDPRLAETLDRILGETGLPASALQLAMREGTLWNPKFSTDLLTEMKARGLRLSVHDFGTEMTALASLDRFPLDAVKPSQDLVRQLPSRQHAATVLSAIIDVAHHKNIEVCAPGIETAEQLTSVKDRGCDSAQGYLLSVPLETDEMRQLIEARPTH